MHQHFLFFCAFWFPLHSSHSTQLMEKKSYSVSVLRPFNGKSLDSFLMPFFLLK